MYHRFGNEGARPKAYLQASLHADEIPGMVVQHHLLKALYAAHERQLIRGEIIVVPAANPIGLSQFLNGVHAGRYELGGAGNFNRNWPDLLEGEFEQLEQVSVLTQKNIRTIRAAMKRSLDARAATSELSSLRLALARLAYDADIVLDLHCDNDALLHLFLTPAHWPSGADLAAFLGTHAVLLSADSGGRPFDEAFSTPWLRLADRFGSDARPVPAACLSGTVELRGTGDVSDALAEQDASALYAFLSHRGLIAADTATAVTPPPLRCAATRLDACDIVRAPVAGVVLYRVALGARVARGTHVADILNPMCDGDVRTDARTAVCCVQEGVVLSLRHDRLVRAGDTVCKVVGAEPLPHRVGLLLED